MATWQILDLSSMAKFSVLDHFQTPWVADNLVLWLAALGLNGILLEMLSSLTEFLHGLRPWFMSLLWSLVLVCGPLPVTIFLPAISSLGFWVRVSFVSLRVESGDVAWLSFRRPGLFGTPANSSMARLIAESPSPSLVWAKTMDGTGT